MKKVIILILTIGLIAVTAVACGGTDVENEVGASGIAALTDGFVDGNGADGDSMASYGGFEYTGDDSVIDWGSDITFDIDDIILPDWDEPCYIDTIEAILAELDLPADMSVKASRFETWEGNDNGYFISQDGSFAFRTDENTEAILEDGIEFIGDEFCGRFIIVIYGASTRSIPEMTVAEKLIVLYENIMPVRF